MSTPLHDRLKAWLYSDSQAEASDRAPTVIYPKPPMPPVVLTEDQCAAVDETGELQ